MCRQARDFILRADEGKTILHAAAEGGSKDMFEAVVAALHHIFGPEKVFAPNAQPLFLLQAEQTSRRIWSLNGFC